MRHSVSEATRVAVLGASGATGRLLVAAALRDGHDVVAISRTGGSFPDQPDVGEAAWRDVNDVNGLAAAVAGCDIVISALGGALEGPTTVCTDAMRATVQVMQAAGIRRLLAVSAYGVWETDDGSLYARAVWSNVGDRMKDKETMEAIVASSDLDWTIVRPPALRNGRASGRYRVGKNLRMRLWSSIGRADLADFLVAEAVEQRFVRELPGIRR